MSIRQSVLIIANFIISVILMSYAINGYAFIGALLLAFSLVYDISLLIKKGQYQVCNSESNILLTASNCVFEYGIRP